jgi:hypothetical protein
MPDKIEDDKVLGSTSWGSLLKAAALIGVPAMIAVYLTIFITSELRTSVLETNRLLTKHADIQVVSQSNIDSRVDMLVREQQRTNRLLQQLCLQGASNASDRRACLE